MNLLEASFHRLGVQQLGEITWLIFADDLTELIVLTSDFEKISAYARSVEAHPILARNIERMMEMIPTRVAPRWHGPPTQGRPERVCMIADAMCRAEIDIRNWDLPSVVREVVRKRSARRACAVHAAA